MDALTRYFGALIPAAALVATLGACGGEKQTQPVSPGVTSLQGAEPAPRAQMSPPPNTPTAANIRISPEILSACNIPDADAYFEFDSANLTSFDRAPLDAIATCFETGPLKGRRMDLVGHADPRGTAEYNMTLGQSRADAVQEYLASQGLSRTMISATSRGAMDATGKDDTGWAHDRRVDIQLAR